MKAKEPVPIYYTRPMLQAMKRNIVTRIEQTDDPEKLSQICNMLSDDLQQLSFEARCQEAKEHARNHLSSDLYNALEEVDFMIDKPFPMELVKSEKEFMAIIEEDVDNDDASMPHEDFMQMMKRWALEE